MLILSYTQWSTSRQHDAALSKLSPRTMRTIFFQRFIFPCELKCLFCNDPFQPRVFFDKLFQFRLRLAPFHNSLFPAVIFHKLLSPSCKYTVRKAVLSQCCDNTVFFRLAQYLELLLIRKFSPPVCHRKRDRFKN